MHAYLSEQRHNERSDCKHISEDIVRTVIYEDVVVILHDLPFFEESRVKIDDYV